jgi:hypothetical protein
MCVKERELRVLVDGGIFGSIKVLEAIFEMRIY